MLELNNLQYYKLTDESISPRALVSHDFVDSIKGSVELTPEEVDQVVLLARDDYKQVLKTLQDQWDPYFPLHPKMAKEGNALDFQGKTDQEITDWLNTLEIASETPVMSYGLVAPWSVIKKNWKPLIRDAVGVDALDGSWRIIFINEGLGHAALLQFNEMNV